MGLNPFNASGLLAKHFTLELTFGQEHSTPHFLNMYEEAYKFPIKVRGGMVIQPH